MAKFCTKCGAQLPDTANVCSNCGAPLNGGVPMYGPQKTFNMSSVIAGILDKLSLIFVILAGVAFLYYFIFAIVDASDAMAEEFRVFLNVFSAGIASAARYLFYAAVTSIGAKLLKK